MVGVVRRLWVMGRLFLNFLVVLFYYNKFIILYLKVDLGFTEFEVYIIGGFFFKKKNRKLLI